MPLLLSASLYCAAVGSVEGWLAGYNGNGRHMFSMLCAVVAAGVLALGLLAWLVRELARGRIAFALAGLLAAPLPILGVLLVPQAYRAGVYALRRPQFLDSLASELLALRRTTPRGGEIFLRHLPGRWASVRRVGGTWVVRPSHGVQVLCRMGTYTLRRGPGHAGWDLFWSLGRWRVGSLIWHYCPPVCARLGPTLGGRRGSASSRSASQAGAGPPKTGGRSKGQPLPGHRVPSTRR